MLAVAARNRARDGVASLPARRRRQAHSLRRSLRRNGHLQQPDPSHPRPSRRVFEEIARIARPGAPILIRDLVRPETEQALEQLVEAHAAPWSPLPAHPLFRFPPRRSHPRRSPRNARPMRPPRRESHANHRPPLERRACLTPPRIPTPCDPAPLPTSPRCAPLSSPPATPSRPSANACTSRKSPNSSSPPNTARPRAPSPKTLTRSISSSACS